MPETRSFPVRRLLLFLAVIAFVVAFIVGFGWLGPEKPQDTQQLYQGLVALGLALGFGSFLV